MPYSHSTDITFKSGCTFAQPGIARSASVAILTAVEYICIIKLKIQDMDLSVVLPDEKFLVFPASFDLY